MVDGKPVVWEACQTLNGSWGYDRDNLDWKPVDMLVRMLVDSVSKGGNLLLNVGPDCPRRVRAQALDRLRGIGEWMRPTRPLDLRLQRLATSRLRPIAATPRTATACTCTSSPGPSATSTWTGWPTGWSTPNAQRRL